jgi:integrin alpha 8
MTEKLETIVSFSLQVIYARDVAPQLAAFGFSVAGGMDLDTNQYPDIVVGAYESDRAVVLR